MEEKNYKYYDDISNQILIALYGKSKKDKKISFYNFNFKDEQCLCLLSISKIIKTLYDFDIEIEEKNFLKRLLYKIKHKEIKINKKIKKGIDCNCFIKTIISATGECEILKNIYKSYYK